MPLTLEARLAKARAVKDRNAQRRRFQRYIAEMREAGLVVEVQTTGFHEAITHPDYTVEAVRRALGH
jgi:hypothetical protein